MEKKRDDVIKFAKKENVKNGEYEFSDFVAVGDYIYFIPGTCNNLIKFNSKTGEFTDLGTIVKDNSKIINKVKFSDAILVRDQIYCFPMHYRNIIKIDTCSGTWKDLDMDTIIYPGTNWFGNIVYANDYIYCRSRAINGIAVINTIDDTCELISENERPYISLNLKGDYIYCIPKSNWGKFLKINTIDNSIDVLKHDVEKMYIGLCSESLTAGNNIFCFLNNYAGYTIKIDTTTDIITFVHDNDEPAKSIKNNSKLGFTKLISTGDNIYCLPKEKNYMIEINTKGSDVIQTYNNTLFKEIFLNAILVKNYIFCIPESGGKILRINTETNECMNVGKELSEIPTSFEKILVVGKDLFCISQKCRQMVRIDISKVI